LKPGRHKLVSFARRTQGLIVAPGNPRAITTLADLCRDGIRFANRARGTGTRVVLDELLAVQKINPQHIAGFDRAEPSHRSAAEAVASGSADAALGIEAAAHARGMGFVPLAQEQYFLVALRDALTQPAVQTLLQLLRGSDWRAQLNALPGYEAGNSGEVLSLRRVLPWWHFRQPKRAAG
ncbi:MAG: substrate-binding domain-containing protein, partial [Burkholderiaceae bacterium]|nr:substrate-binding domain-containing protein [Burkholderiaceae bacterium]